MTRILVLSDIHGNLTALETVLDHAKDDYDALWCLGDVVGYGPCPNECVALMQEKAALCVMGNHDWAALGRDGVDVDSFNPVARDAILWTRNQLSTESRRYLDGLHVEPVRVEGADDFLITHASPREPVWEYILSPGIAMENFAVFREPICLVGHTHKPAIFRWRLFAHDFQSHVVQSEAHSDAHSHAAEFHPAESAESEGETVTQAGREERHPFHAKAPPIERQQSEGQWPDGQWIASVDMLDPIEGEPIRLETSGAQRLILNPGSVGQPRDNDARAAYAIMDLEEKSWRYHRVEYPIELTQSQMRAEGLPQRLIDRLSFGW